MSIEPLPNGALLANDDYEITGVLGRGGFGITYLAKDRQLRSTVAVKEYAPADFAERALGTLELAATDVSEFDWGLNRFREEGRTLARFANTPSIVSVARIFEENLTVYLVMEYIDGPNIVEYSDSLTDPDQIVRLLQELRGALSRMHDVGFIHSDLKPENILIRRDTGEPVLIDFGSTRQQSVDRTMALVTPHYSPVEQYASDTAHGPYTDIYSLSATFYRVITGKKPPDAPSRVLDDDCPALVDDKSLSGYRLEILAQIDAGMRPLPKDRPQSIPEWTSITVHGAAIANTKSLKDEPLQPAEPKVEHPRQTSSTSRWDTLSQEQKIGIGGVALAGFISLIVAFSPSGPKSTPLSSALNAQRANGVEQPVDMGRDINASLISWKVAVDGKAWTPIRLKSRLDSLPRGVNYDLRFKADEPFRIKTSEGLAIATKPGNDYGLVEGEVYLKNVNALPQSVEARLVRRRD